MEKKPGKIKMVCQNCKMYSRPICTRHTKKYTARKNTCEWFRAKK